MEAKVNSLIQTLEEEKQYNAEVNVRVTAVDLATRVYQNAVPLGEGGDKVADEVLILAQRIQQFISTGVCK